eukprot:gene22604-23814_t
MRGRKGAASHRNCAPENRKLQSVEARRAASGPISKGSIVLEAALTDPAPPSALLVVAHGDGGEARLNDSVRHLAGQLARRLDIPVEWALLKQPETFAQAHARLGAAASGLVLVYPFFMSEGYFVRVKLPNTLAEHGFSSTMVLPPLGADPALVDLIAHRLRLLASLSGGREPADVATLMVAHGSRSGEPASRRRAETIATTLGARGLGTIHLAFIEEPPSVADQLAAIAPEVVIGLFASEGTHALDDVAALVDGRDGVLHHVRAIGTDEGMADLVLQAIEAQRHDARLLDARTNAGRPPE